ncbi:MAG: 2-oxoacid:ferredoxin oxidoreductase subunit beta [Thermoplasmatota archaeon]
MAETWKEWKGKDPIWCPGCGDFGVLTALQKAAANLELDPAKTVLVTGIGCSGNITAYFQSYGFHGIHGRALPVATGIKLANPDLTVLVAGGDGDGFGIGLSHFLHAARRNVDLTYIVMDNQVYGLTKGQTSPTTPSSMTTKASPLGPMAQPLNPLALSLSAGATFVAQAFAGDQKGLIDILEEGIRHPGFSFVNTQSPCVTYNFMNTYAWFRTSIRPLGGDYDPTDWNRAMQVANDRTSVPTGILYRSRRETFGPRNDAGRAAPTWAAARPLESARLLKGEFQGWLDEVRVR